MGPGQLSEPLPDPLHRVPMRHATLRHLADTAWVGLGVHLYARGVAESQKAANPAEVSMRPGGNRDDR